MFHQLGSLPHNPGHYFFHATVSSLFFNPFILLWILPYATWIRPLLSAYMIPYPRQVIDSFSSQPLWACHSCSLGWRQTKDGIYFIVHPMMMMETLNQCRGRKKGSHLSKACYPYITIVGFLWWWTSHSCIYDRAYFKYQALASVFSIEPLFYVKRAFTGDDVVGMTSCRSNCSSKSTLTVTCISFYLDALIFITEWTIFWETFCKCMIQWAS